MCLTKPAEVIKIEPAEMLLLGFDGLEVIVPVAPHLTLAAGDKVLLAANFVVSKLEQAEYEELVRIMNENNKTVTPDLIRSLG